MNILMKLKLLDLACKLQKAGIEKAFHEVRSDDQFAKAWKKFWRIKKNRRLKRKIEIWGENFILLKPGKIFLKNEKPNNALEIIAIIYLINDVRVSENEIFYDRDDLIWEVDRIKTHFAEVIAETIRNKNILDADHLAVI